MPIIQGIGLNMSSLSHGDLDGAARLAQRWAEIGCSHIEVSAFVLDVVHGGRMNPHRVKRVQQIIADSGLKPVLHATHVINFMDRPREAMHRAVASASIEVCAALGCPSMVIHSGHVPLADWVCDKDGLLAYEREGFQWLGALAAEAKVQIAVENLIAAPEGAGEMYYGADPRALAAQLEATDHPMIGGCLDFGHAHTSANTLGFDYIEALEIFSPYVWHLHQHDNCGIPHGIPGITDPGMMASYGVGDMHAPMYWGTIPWDDLLPRMKFREGTFGMVELKGRYYPEAQTVADTAWIFARYLNGEGQLSNPWQTA